MAVYINTLNGGNITIGSGGGPAVRATTIITTTEDGVQEFDIIGELNSVWLENNGFWSEGNWNKTITSIDIGSHVTSIGSMAFQGMSYDGIVVTIGDNVTSIGNYAFVSPGITSITVGRNVETIGINAFQSIDRLTNITFQGKTLAQVQAMQNYSWGISNTSIINVA